MRSTACHQRWRYSSSGGQNLRDILVSMGYDVDRPWKFCCFLSIDWREEPDMGKRNRFKLFWPTHDATRLLTFTDIY